MVAIVDVTVVEPFGGIFAEVITGKVYLITYDEDVWLSLPKERQEFCKQTWLSKAEAIVAVQHVVLKLVPDELFPVNGHEKPYVAWQQEIGRPPECGFTVRSQITVTIETDAKYVDPVMRADISRALEGNMPGTPFRIVTRGGNIIEAGRI
jgi:hypothetical protein